MANNDIPINEGCYRVHHRNITLRHQGGTPAPPASMAGYSKGQPIPIDTLLRAFASFSDQAPAPDANSLGLIAFGGIDLRSNQPFAYLSLEGTGWGGIEICSTATAFSLASLAIVPSNPSKL